MFYGSFWRISPLSVWKFLHKTMGSWGDLGIEGTYKCRALQVSSCREVTAYSWCVGGSTGQPCKLCHLSVPPSMVADVTQPQACLLVVKWDFWSSYNGKWKVFKVPEIRVWMPDQVSVTIFREKAYFQGKSSFHPFCQGLPQEGFACFVCVYFVQELYW